MNSSSPKFRNVKRWPCLLIHVLCISYLSISLNASNILISVVSDASSMLKLLQVKKKK